MNEVKDKILAVLRSDGGFVSGQRLCEDLNMSRAAVSKHVQGLRKLGYEIESVPRKGHRLVTSVDTPLDVEVHRHLDTILIGRDYTFKTQIDSTNSYLADLPLSDCRDGMVVAADQQTAGRGRMQRIWFSPAGLNLYFSVLLQPRKNPGDIPQLALIAALAIVDGIKAVAPSVNAGVKWPNDVLVDGKKLAGILCEMQGEADVAHKVILGMGLNVNVEADQFPEELQGQSTSLLVETGSMIARPMVMAAILNSLDKHYHKWLKEGLEPFLPMLNENLLLVGTKITIDRLGKTTEGIIQGLSDDGGLILRDGESDYTVYSGEIIKKD